MDHLGRLDLRFDSETGSEDLNMVELDADANVLERSVAMDMREAGFDPKSVGDVSAYWARLLPSAQIQYSDYQLHTGYFRTGLRDQFFAADETAGADFPASLMELLFGPLGSAESEV